MAADPVDPALADAADVPEAGDDDDVHALRPTRASTATAARLIDTRAIGRRGIGMMPILPH
jgi:hypothetical protein